MKNSCVLLSLHGPLAKSQPSSHQPPVLLSPVTLSPSVVQHGDPLQPGTLSLLGSSYLELGLSPFGPLLLPAPLEAADILSLWKGPAGSQGRFRF